MLQSLFNRILNTGIFPEEWCRAIIVPIYKRGKVNDPQNYRPISLLPCVSKIFTKIISNRLYSWATDTDNISEFQCGFVKGKSTIDNLFILQSLVGKYLGKSKGSFYSVFVDFSRAFDSIPHQHLFYSLLSNQLHDRVVNVLRNMYCKLQSCVQLENFAQINNNQFQINVCLSEYFNCTIGTRQGCMVNPFIFIFYLNELIRMSQEHDCKGIYVNDQYANVSMLLYADDLVIIGDQVNRVQKVLNALSKFCSKWGLYVNMSKTKAMVFRNGGIVKYCEKFYFDNKKIDIVSYYKYLGLTMSTRLSWNPAQTTLAAHANKVLHMINKVNYNCNYSFKCACNIFDKCVLPTITYGCEIWGLDVHKSIENVHTRFCKGQLGVGISTPNCAVLGADH